VCVFCFISFISAASYPIPCTEKGTPTGCDPSLVKQVKCNTGNPNGNSTVTVDEKVSCADFLVYFKQILNVQFYQIPNTDQCLEITMKVGECWGKNPINGGDYGCQGQCGAGCINGCGLFKLGGAWSRNCLRHDVCSWYFGAEGGASHTQCGKSYNQASGDLINCKCELTGFTCSF